MQIKIYHYKSCSTCRKAIKFLQEKNIEFEDIAIVENPPSKDELRNGVKSYDGEFKKLFNTSGLVYREMKLSQKIKDMSEEEAIDLLSNNGKLIKRPYIVKSNQVIVGFKEDILESFLS